MNQFTRRYRQIVDASGLNFSEIARRANIQPSTASNPYAGNKGDTFFYTADRVADALGYVPVVFYTPLGMISRLAVDHLWGQEGDNYPGKLIEFHREQKDLSRRELSALSGVPIKNVSQYERGIDGPSMQRLWKIGRALGLEVRYFVQKQETLAERLEELREKNDLTIHGLAEKCGLEHNLLQNIVPGSPKTLCLKSLETIAHAFDVLALVYLDASGRKVGDPSQDAYVQVALKQRREELGLTARDLAKWAGLEHNTVTSIENREHEAYLRSVQRLAGVMGLFPQYLVKPKRKANVALPTQPASPITVVQLDDQKKHI